MSGRDTLRHVWENTFMDVTQVCHRCKEAKPQDAYHPGKWGQVGNYCRDCCAEYRRAWRTTSAKTDRKPSTRVRVPRQCKRDQCVELPTNGVTYCAEHSPINNPSTEYRAVHQGVTRKRGKASAQVCACGAQAQEWAYDHADPAPLYGTTPRGRAAAYSADPAHYMPMCKPCHARFDRGR